MYNHINEIFYMPLDYFIFSVTAGRICDIFYTYLNFIIFNIKCIHKYEKIGYQKTYKQNPKHPPLLTSVSSNPTLSLANNQNTCIASFFTTTRYSFV